MPQTKFVELLASFNDINLLLLPVFFLVFMLTCIRAAYARPSNFFYIYLLPPVFIYWMYYFMSEPAMVLIGYFSVIIFVLIRNIPSYFQRISRMISLLAP